MSIGDSPPHQFTPTHHTGSISELPHTHTQRLYPPTSEWKEIGHKFPPDCLGTFLRNKALTRKVTVIDQFLLETGFKASGCTDVAVIYLSG